MLPRIAALDACIARWRRTVAGEIGWLLLLTLAMLMQVLAVRVALSRPTQIDLYQFINNARGWMAGNPYPAGTHDPNAPHVILFFSLFTGLSATSALVIWLVVSYLCAAATLWIIARESGGVPRHVAMASIALFFAVGAAADVPSTGNMIWPIWLAFTIAWRLARHDRPLASGAVVGILITAKPFFGLWFVYFLWRRHWLALAGVIVGAAVTLGVGVAATGLETWRAWFDVLHRITWYDERFNASILGGLARTVGPDRIVWALLSVLIATGTAWAIRRHGSDAVSSVDQEWTALLLAALLISPLGWRYYLCLAWGPAVLWLARQRPGRAVIGSLVLLWICPVFRGNAHGALYRASVGSLVFWVLLIAWGCVVERVSREQT